MLPALANLTKQHQKRTEQAVDYGKKKESSRVEVAVSQWAMVEAWCKRHATDLGLRKSGMEQALKSGLFVALTEELRERFARLAAFGRRAPGPTLRLHALTAELVDALIHGTGSVQADSTWAAQIERIRAAQERTPALPTTLRAQLLPYQEEGFRWLSRLASWGAGACLADDMGLGKTVQALAVVQERAPLGPTLVVAPTSLCSGWVSEALRFAPALRPVRLPARGRGKMLAALGPFDLLVVSYGMMVRERKRLAGLELATVVLDEAQAIKTPSTQRAAAATKLRAGFRLATTGTPVENRLEELWSLFRFLNPSLLGSKKDFDERFAQPIERERDNAALRDLRRLVSPFILRRTKADVLPELPARTQVAPLGRGTPGTDSGMTQMRARRLEGQPCLASSSHGRPGRRARCRVVPS